MLQDQSGNFFELEPPMLEDYGRDVGNVFTPYPTILVDEVRRCLHRPPMHDKTVASTRSCGGAVRRYRSFVGTWSRGSSRGIYGRARVLRIATGGFDQQALTSRH
jgi:hypothetical protein